jgi:hypothetical protein
MPAPLLLMLLAALIATVLFGPALLRQLALLVTGSLVVSELVLAGTLLLPSLRVLFRDQLPLPAQPRLLPAPKKLLPSGEVRGGIIRARDCLTVDGDRCVAALVRACDRHGVYGWRLLLSELEVECEERRLRVCGVVILDGEPLLGETELTLPRELPGTLERILLHDGDQVELRGTIAREQAAAGYRDSAEIEVMRGVPGNPVTIRRLC